MLNASVGVQRVIGRVRRSSSQESTRVVSTPLASGSVTRPATRWHRLISITDPSARRSTFALPALAIPRHLAMPRLAIPRHLSIRTTLRRLGHERTTAVAVAGIVLAASFLSVSPGRPSGDTGGPTGDGAGPRLAIGGPVGDGGTEYGERRVLVRRGTGRRDHGCGGRGPAAADAADGRRDPAATRARQGWRRGDRRPRRRPRPSRDRSSTTARLLKPVAVNTNVPDGSDLIRTYKVKAGDTLAGIAKKFDVSTMTLWWANKLKAKNALVRGQELKIPPVTGLVVEVKSTDTLASLARRYKVAETEILTTNQIDDRNLVVGQVLVLPDAKGAPIKTPEAQAEGDVDGRPRAAAAAGQPRTGAIAQDLLRRQLRLARTRRPHQPVLPLRPLRRSTSTAARATASSPRRRGTVTFAGWKSNGGGYQVWISHGSGLYTTYNHMSSVSVGRGQRRRQGPARRAHGRDRVRDGLAPALRGLARPDLEWRHAASTRWPTSRPLAAPGRRSARIGRALGAWDNDHDVPRPREDLGPCRRRR